VVDNTKKIQNDTQMTRFWQSAKPYLLAVIISFSVSGILIGILGYNVPRAFQALLLKSFSSQRGFIQTLQKFIPLTLATYAFAIPFRIKFFNIGGWGQMLFGGSMVAIVGIALASFNLPAIIMIPILLLVAMAAGAFLSLIAGALKTYYNINPIISTIMLNFVAYYFVNFVATTNPWKASLGHPMTLKIPESGRLPELLPGLHMGILIVLLIIFIIHFMTNKMVLGYEINATGINQHAAKVYGINMERTLMLTFLMGGAMAGLGGGIEVMGVHHRLIEGFALTSGAQYGIFGILTALICKGNPLGVPVSALFISALLVGADAMQRTAQVPVEIVFVTQALVVLLIVVFRSTGNK